MMSINLNRLDHVLNGQDLTPGQQFALLKMLRSDLAQQIVGALEHSSTARSCYADFIALAEKDYARRKANGYHTLTEVKGVMVAQRLAVRLAKALGIPLPVRRMPDFRAGRRIHTPGRRGADTSYDPW